jgi:DNA replication protein DnaC
VLDDLGTENPTPFVQEHLDTIFDYRLMHNLPMIITTNCRGSELPFRILSRLKRGGTVITIDASEYKPGPV